MGRELLNSMPEWALIVLFTGGAALIGLGAVLASHRWLPRQWTATESSDVVMGACGVVLTLFSVVLAFVIFDLYTGYASAESNVNAEANSLRQIVQDAQAFPPPERQRLEQAVSAYISEVSLHEFPALKDGGQDPKVETKLAQLSTALQRYAPENQAEIAFYRSAVDQVNQLASERGSRVSIADTAVPSAFLVLLVILAIVGVGTACLIRMEHAAVDTLLITMISLVIGAGFVTALILQYPFSGSVAISPEALVHGTLGEVVRHFH
jgi:hypothetical protein